MSAKISKNVFLPLKIKKTLENEPCLGVCVVFKNDKFKRWFSMGMNDCDYCKEKLSEIVMKNKFSDFEKEFLIVDKFGNVCFSNCDANVTCDENGIIHINENECYVTAIENNRWVQLQKVSKVSLEDVIQKRPTKHSKSKHVENKVFSDSIFQRN